MAQLNTLTVRFGAALVAACASLITAGPVSADTVAALADSPASVPGICTGTASSEAAVAPLQDGDRLENGVRVVVRFSSDSDDEACALTASATWHNADTGASGSEEFTIAPAADAATGGRYGTAGYNRAEFWTGTGSVVVTVSTHPDSPLRLTV